ncbi:winged helix-turn-helix transcriptional regulator [Nitriliruptoraceae bacterium ZYF776]|nr:winged helix-turn-helix transcriptional regulator [Profundirhabdus halotolerans]
MAGANDPQVALERATELFRALANPLRVAIVRELGHGERTVTELVDRLEVAQPRISEHLAILRAANLVVGTRAGRQVTYHLVDEHVAHIVDDAVLHASEPTPAA